MFACKNDAVIQIYKKVSKLFMNTQLLKLLSTITVYVVIFEGFIFRGRQV